MAKILVVDDDENIRQYYMEELSDDGHQVSAVASGHELLRIIDIFKPHVVILDIKLVDYNGLELLKWQTNTSKKGDSMKGRKLYVGNLSHSVTNDELEELFADYGDVEKVNIIEGKGFGFIEMYSRSEADRAKQALNGSELKGRVLKINEARPPKERRRGGYRKY